MKNFLAVLFVSILLCSCNKEVKVFKDTNNYSLEGSWDVRTVVGTYYLNDTLWKRTVFTAPFTPDDPYRDYMHVDITKDSIFFLNADSTKSKGRYQADSGLMVINYIDSLRYVVSDQGLRLDRYKQYYDFGGRHKDTLTFSLKRN